MYIDGQRFRDSADECNDCGCELPPECGLTCHDCQRQKNIKDTEATIALHMDAINGKLGELKPDEYLKMQTEIIEQYKRLNEFKRE